ncbi:MAG TPA: ATP-dependent RecD-like DNA helicase [Bacillota bacterium]|nr:ATP-dependent RecD-like DNA helicase [Bacillota bacterium]HQE65584.1 ATP-dependent RecD-like DNA helicase [Bacillota bacterium]HQI16288.1 ATP-dependent RecD-like DNA helicase [Bacillota bacterium]HQL35217.1 ATP-dependent RecD-like DNA helicase [Bacillota bacterium]
MDEIQGTICEIIFRNEYNGYTVLDLECDSELHTLIGYFSFLNLGETIKAYGSWVQHPSYGNQFKVETYTTVTPATINGIEKYLSSGLIPGIGPHTARKLVEKFGLDTLDIMQYNPDRLTEVEGIGQKKAEKITEAFQEQKELKDIMMFLEQYGIGPAYAVRIYKTYGENTIKEIKENPYKLADDIFGIGFKMADRIAMSMGVSKFSEYRTASGTRYVLNQYHGNGHTFVPQEELVRSSAALLDVDEAHIEDTIVRLFIDNKLVVENIGDIRGVYSVPFFKAESGTARRLMQLMYYKIPPMDLDMDGEIAEIEKAEGIELADKQKTAVREALTQGILVITGGPGTGKTTTIKTIISIFEKHGLEVLLAAPTGRAAKRMQEATGREAKTIHRLLEFGYGDSDEEMFFQKNEESPLECDVIIIDEVSMIDILLANNLLKAIAEGTRVILVGDVDQLPSVGPGNVLRDIIDSGVLPVVRLDEIFRQAESSMIVVNAHRINRGEPPVLSSKNGDFFLIRQETQEDIVSTIIELCTSRLPKYTGLDPYEGIQVLSPMKKGLCGVLNLNHVLQEVLNPRGSGKEEKQHREVVFRVGDKVMQIKNNYRMKWQNINNPDMEGEGVFNGDLGTIVNIDNEELYLEVVFDRERKVRYDFTVLDELEHAYALTVHKSQGSEFPVLVMPLTFGPPMLMTRNLLYTALTRAKSMVVLVGKERFLYQMISNNHIITRHSGLRNRLSVTEY